MTRTPPLLETANVFQEVVNRISHQLGKVVEIMNGNSVTLPQILILRRIQLAGGCTPSELSKKMSMSISSISQIADRLYNLELIVRHDDKSDRRKKKLVITKRAETLLKKIVKARSEEYAQGISILPASLRGELHQVLSKCLAEIGGQ